MRRLAVLALALALVACGGEESSGPATTIEGESQPATSNQPTNPEPATSEPEDAGPVVLLETAAGSDIVVRVEIADDDQERQVGIMNRESLPDLGGMIFLFDDDVSGGFWMKDTLIPLSIAFADADGTILRILDMEPCEADPCEIYDPGVSYRSALEVNQGAFAEWGVAEGDTLTLRQ